MEWQLSVVCIGHRRYKLSECPQAVHSARTLGKQNVKTRVQALTYDARNASGHLTVLTERRNLTG